MKFIELGRTGAQVSVAGLGCGGPSRLGLRHGASNAEAATVVRGALDLGVTFIDTAEAYGTEEAVGLGIRGRRDEVFISTKGSPVERGEDWREGALLSAAQLRAKVEASLSRLGTDRIDLYNLHGVAEAHYDHGVEVLLPELKRLQAEGKIRFLGLTEAFGRETQHETLERAVIDAYFDVVMVGFNLLNPSARKTVFLHTQANRIGTLIMFAVRRALSRPEALHAVLDDLEAQGAVPPGTAKAGLAFVTEDPEVRSLVEASYRFVRHEPGADVVLTGTGSLVHLRENVAAILAPPLPDRLLDRLDVLFGGLASVSGN